MLASCTQRSCCLKSVPCRSASTRIAVDNSHHAWPSLTQFLLISLLASIFLPYRRLHSLILSLTERLHVTQSASIQAPWRAMVYISVQSFASFATRSSISRLSPQTSERGALSNNSLAYASRLTCSHRDVPVRTRVCSSCLWEVCCRQAVARTEAVLTSPDGP